MHDIEECVLSMRRFSDAVAVEDVLAEYVRGEHRA